MKNCLRFIPLQAPIWKTLGHYCFLTLVLCLTQPFATLAAGLLLQETDRIGLPGVKGRIDHMAVDVARKRLFVVALGNNTVEVIDLETRRVVRSLSGLKEPQGLLLVPNSNRFIVTQGDDIFARVYDTATFELLTEIRLREDSDNIRLDPDLQRSYIGCGIGESGALFIVDAAKGSVIADISLSGHPESFQLERKGKRVFVNVPSSSEIAVVDRDKQRVVAKWPVPGRGNFPMALDEEHGRLFIATRGPSKLLAIDTESGRVVAQLDSVKDADDIFYDAAMHHIYVSGGGGSISVFDQIDPNHYILLENIATRKGARTSLFVPEWRTLFVGLPSNADGLAEIRAYNARPEGDLEKP